MLLIAALIVVGGGVGLFFLLRGGGDPEDVAEDFVQGVFDADCDELWSLLSPNAQTELADNDQARYCANIQPPPNATDPEVTGSRIVSEGNPTVVEVTFAGVPDITSLPVNVVDVDGDWLVEGFGVQGEVPDVPDLPELPDPPTGERVGERVGVRG